MRQILAAWLGAMVALTVLLAGAESVSAQSSPPGGGLVDDKAPRCDGCATHAGGEKAPDEEGYLTYARRLFGDSFSECLDRRRCPGRFPAAGTDAGAPAVAGGEPVALPTLGEAVASCPAPPAPVIGRNPQAEGVTGLETYLWAAPQPPVSSVAVVRGYEVGCTITPVRWTWRTGDGGVYARERPGGPHPDNPAGHVYETKGLYELSLTVLWRAATTAGSTTLSATTSEPYRVFEIRSVLTG